MPYKNMCATYGSRIKLWAIKCPTPFPRGGSNMTSETRERMNVLCKRIQEEQDRVTFTKLITELNELLAQKSDRLTSTQRKPSSNQANP